MSMDEEQLSSAPEPPEREPLPERKPMSRAAAFAAMGVVTFAIILLTMLAPGSGVDIDAPPPVSDVPAGAGADAANHANDANTAGSDAPLRFTLKDMNGVDVKLASFKGKPIVMNFWATWCGPCRAEIPSLVELQKAYSAEGKDVVILGISVDDPVEKLKPYASQMKMNYPVLVGNGREDVQDAFGPLWGIPVTVFIDREGRIAKKHSGIASKEQFEQEIKALL